MTRYKLPAELGGGERDAYIVTSGNAMFAVDDGEVTISLSLLTEVPPPIPPEPEPGAWLIGGSLAARFAVPAGWTAWVWQANFKLPALGGEVHESTAGRTWVTCGNSWDKVWAEIGGPDVTITRLVPESSDRAQPPTVDLPWRYTDRGGDSVEIWLIDKPDGVGVALAVEEGADDDRRRAMWLDSHKARMGAIAAIRAADEAIGGEE